MNRYQSDNNKLIDVGFTIVELLIVVVIIAILATITVVTFNGMQDKAYNTRIITGVRSYKQAIELYFVYNGEYPKTTPEKNGDRITTVCLGTGYVNNACGTISNVNVYEDSGFNNDIAKVLGGNPLQVNDQSLPSGPEAFVGAVYGNDIVTFNGFTYGRTIQYALHGANADCGLSGAYSYRLTITPAVTACEILIEGLEK